MRSERFGQFVTILTLSLAAVSAFGSECLTDSEIMERQQIYRNCLGGEMQSLLNQVRDGCASNKSIDEMASCRSTTGSIQVLEIAKANCRQRAQLDVKCGDEGREKVKVAIHKKPAAPLPPKIPSFEVTKAPAKKEAKDHPAEKGSSQTAEANPREARSKMNQTVPQEYGTAQTEADADLAWCSQLQSTASRCCGNPLSCTDQLSDEDRASLNQIRGLLAGQGPQQMGLTEYCRQMDSLSSSGSNVNAGLSSVCAAQQSSCKNTCQQLVSKYQALLSNCNGCESESIYSSAVVQLTSSQNSCRSLQSRADLLAVNGIGMGDPAAYSQYCQSVASSSPQNGGMGSGGTLGAGWRLKTQDRRGEAGFASAVDGRGPSDFNVPSGPSEPTAFEGIRYDAAAAALSAARTVNTVPNNSGGAIPGGGDSRSGAQLDGRAAGAAARSGAAGTVADIEQGFRSSGGYSYPAGTVADRGLSGMGGFGGFQPASSVERDDDGGYFGLDLKQFLPGGSRDPSRRVAGRAGRPQFHSKEEDIWRRISIKIIEKCKLGLLFQCR